MFLSPDSLKQDACHLRTSMFFRFVRSNSLSVLLTELSRICLQLTRVIVSTGNYSITSCKMPYEIFSNSFSALFYLCSSITIKLLLTEFYTMWSH
jgi:hypothetical protein